MKRTTCPCPTSFVLVYLLPTVLLPDPFPTPKNLPLVVCFRLVFADSSQTTHSKTKDKKTPIHACVRAHKTHHNITPIITNRLRTYVKQKAFCPIHINNIPKHDCTPSVSTACVYVTSTNRYLLPQCGNVRFVSKNNSPIPPPV